MQIEYIKQLDEIGILKEEVFKQILGIDSEVEKDKLETALLDRAKELSMRTVVSKRLSAYKRDYKKIIQEKKSNITIPEDPLYSRSYIITTKRGNISVNTSLLSQYIRDNSHYYIVKKQGSETFFIYWYDEGYYKQMSKASCIL